MKFFTAAVGTGVDAASGGAQATITTATGTTAGILGIIITTIIIPRRHRRRAVLAIIPRRQNLALHATTGITTIARRVQIIIGMITDVPTVLIGIRTTGRADPIVPI